LFVPDRYNWWQQKFCDKPQCRQASKAQSQRRWLSKPEIGDGIRAVSMHISSIYLRKCASLDS
jgi:hypothetical protein